MSTSNGESIVDLLNKRECGSIRRLNPLSQSFHSCRRPADSSLTKLAELTENLREAISQPKKWTELEYVMGAILTQILDTASTSAEQMFKITPQRIQEREFFIQIGGVDLILQLFRKPWTESDARMINQATIQRRSELWNEVLVILREVAFAVQSSTTNIFGNDHIIFLFTLLSHVSVFENTVNLLEEILTFRLEPFHLALVPDFSSLISKFSTRELSQFCRILSLVLYEPEDRQLLEGSHTLNSLELIQLRRDRMAKVNSCVDKNQTLIIGMPIMLPRLVQLLSIVNYGPSLYDLLRNNVLSNNPIPADLLHTITGTSGPAEWDMFRELDVIVQGERSARLGVDQDSSSATASPNPRKNEATGLDLSEEQENRQIHSEMLSVLSRSALDMGSLVEIVNLTRTLGLNTGGRSTQSGKKSYRDAKRHLMFQSLLLSPHQIEILFVLCTLLSGRRKIDVQNQLDKLGLQKLLVGMFDRLSWNQPSICEGSSQQQELHGPGCACTPESAWRVQFLRLVHNFFDRDFSVNPVKYGLLTGHERDALAENPEVSIRKGLFIPPENRGLLSKIMHVLQNEPAESLYQFWLSSCLEAFLRGTDVKEQLFVARGGVLAHTTRMIAFSGQRTTNTLQTAFDLLGELVKANIYTFQMIEDSLDETTFVLFMDVVMSNLVDSNVFLRSLYLSLESLPDQRITAPNSSSNWHQIGESSVSEIARFYQSPKNGSDESCLIGSAILDSSMSSCKLITSATGAVTSPAGSRDVGYITHSWVQFAPELLLTPRTSKRLDKSSRPKLAMNGVPVAQSSRTMVVPVHHTNSEIGNRLSASQSRGGNDRSPLASFIDSLHSMASHILGAGSRELADSGSDSDDDSVFSSQNAENLLDGVSLEALSAALGIDTIDLGLETPEYVHSDRAGAASASSSMSSSPRTPNPPHSIGPTSVSDSSECNPELAGYSILTAENRTQNSDKVKIMDSASDQLFGKGGGGQSAMNLPMFLLRNREKIVFKLLSTTSIRTINHENICCLNTTILILLLANSRGQLAKLMSAVRLLAEEESWHESERLQKSADDCDADVTVEVIGDAMNYVVDPGKQIQSAPIAVKSTAKGDLLMANFRELLWYWKEYYLRRGRDRLSLEFSTHIPFAKWFEFVDSLCRDDGCGASLLAKPVLLPRSPYSTPPRCRISASPDIIQF